MKRFRHILEAAGFVPLLFLIRALPIEWASNAGGFLGRTIGPRLGITNRARRNLRLAMPDLDPDEIERTVRAMWDNLGRVIFEYPHLGTITDPAEGRVELVDVERVRDLGTTRAAGILASAHLANWEVMPVVAARNDVDMTVIVRQPNNPLMRGAVDRMRGIAGGRRAAKGRSGSREVIGTLRDGRVLGILFDQKHNRGIPAPFFGHQAMTTPAPAQLALSFGCPLIPVRIERLGPARFRMTSYPPLRVPEIGDRQARIAAMTRELNEILEGWIRARPEQWLWLHRRWPREAQAATTTRKGNVSAAENT